VGQSQAGGNEVAFLNPLGVGLDSVLFNLPDTRKAVERLKKTTPNANLDGPFRRGLSRFSSLRSGPTPTKESRMMATSAIGFIPASPLFRKTAVA
jgi:hypothetical protein